MEHNNPSSGVEEQQHRHPSGFTPPRAQSHPTRFIITDAGMKYASQKESLHYYSPKPPSGAFIKIYPICFDKCLSCGRHIVLANTNVAYSML